MVGASRQALNLVKSHVSSSVTSIECPLLLPLELSKSVTILPCANDCTFSVHHWLRRDQWLDVFSGAWLCNSTITQGSLVHRWETLWILDCPKTRNEVWSELLHESYYNGAKYPKHKQSTKVWEQEKKRQEKKNTGGLHYLLLKKIHLIHNLLPACSYFTAFNSFHQKGAHCS